MCSQITDFAFAAKVRSARRPTDRSRRCRGRPGAPVRRAAAQQPYRQSLRGRSTRVTRNLRRDEWSWLIVRWSIASEAVAEFVGVRRPCGRGRTNAAARTGSAGLRGVAVSGRHRQTASLPSCSLLPRSRARVSSRNARSALARVLSGVRENRISYSRSSCADSSSPASRMTRPASAFDHSNTTSLLKSVSACSGVVVTSRLLCTCCARGHVEGLEQRIRTRCGA